MDNYSIYIPPKNMYGYYMNICEGINFIDYSIFKQITKAEYKCIERTQVRLTNNS